ncbi:MAG: protein phosphatase CheZ [Desulfovibrionaceae bacterium]|nr:protein phosphatase CheZ [Desulfovibrionaceae bacterium]
MQTNEDLILTLMERISEKTAANLKQAIMASVEREISRNLSKAMLEGEFYRRVNEDLQKGLKDIYNEIKSVRKGGGLVISSRESPDELFNKASDQLDAVLRTTEKAAFQIIDIVEKLQDLQSALGRIVKGFETGGVKKEDRLSLERINQTLGKDLMSIMAALSFQDLTGQRIKIIVEAMKKIERIVRQVFVSTGLMIKGREAEPQKDFESLEQEARTKASELYGPQLGSDQDEVDDMLSQLGLD